MATKTLEDATLARGDEQALAPLLGEISRLQALSLREDWEFDAIAVGSVETSRILLGKVRRISDALGTSWYSPAVGTDGEGAISLEWRSPSTALTLFANADGSTESLYSWGSNMWSEVETVLNPGDDQLMDLWRRHFQANGKLP